MSFSRHGDLSIRCGKKKPGVASRAHSRPSSASMSLSRISLDGSVSTGARLCFAGHRQNAIQWSCRSSVLQRTVNRILTVCLSRGGNPSCDSVAGSFAWEYEGVASNAEAATTKPRNRIVHWDHISNASPSSRDGRVENRPLRGNVTRLKTFTEGSSYDSRIKFERRGFVADLMA